MEDQSGQMSPRDRLVRDFSDDSYFERQKAQLQANARNSMHSAISPGADNRVMNMQDATSPHTDNSRILSVIEEQSYADSIGSVSVSEHTERTSTGISTSSSGKLTDFFGTEVFQIVLHNPTTAHQLTNFARNRFCGENMEFLEQVRN